MITFKDFLTETKSKDPTREANDKANVQKIGRYELVGKRIRTGRIQKRVKVSTAKGYEFKQGKLKRMSSTEKLNRKRGQRTAKFKKRAHMKLSLMHRKKSLRKRRSLGL